MGKSLFKVTINTALHFVHNFPHHIIQLNLDEVNWNEMIRNSDKLKLISPYESS
jgi:hypothetical protein